MKYCTDYSINWKFITKRAPWVGGFYERLIGLTKNCLKKVLGSSLISFVKLQTLLTEVESLLNDRPLMYVSNDIDDCEPLTPSLLMYGYKLRSFPVLVDVADYLDTSYDEREILSQVNTKCQLILQNFWDRWSHEYLAALRERHAHQNVQKSGTSVETGDVVLVHDSTPRNRWKTAIVTRLLPCSDNKVRSVELRFPSGLKTTRPVSKLYPLEVNHRFDGEDLVISNDVNTRIMPSRESARVAKSKISEQCRLLN